MAGSSQVPSEPSSPVLVSTQTELSLSQVPLSQPPSSQQSATDQHEAVDVVEYESDDPTLICHVCNTHARPLSYEDPIWGSDERWALCEGCEQWFHYGCSRYHNKPIEDFIAVPFFGAMADCAPQPA